MITLILRYIFLRKTLLVVAKSKADRRHEGVEFITHRSSRVTQSVVSRETGGKMILKTLKNKEHMYFASNLYGRTKNSYRILPRYIFIFG